MLKCLKVRQDRATFVECLVIASFINLCLLVTYLSESLPHNYTTLRQDASPASKDKTLILHPVWCMILFTF